MSVCGYTDYSSAQRTRMKNHFTAVYQAAEEGGYVAYAEEVPGAITQGETLDEARQISPRPSNWFWKLTAIRVGSNSLKRACNPRDDHGFR